MFSSAKRILEAEWLSHKITIREMYLKERLSLDDMLHRLKSGGFYVTKAQLEYKLKVWGFRKKIPKNAGAICWQYIDHRMNKRKKEGKQTKVYLSGQVMDEQTIRKETNRHRKFIYGDPPSPQCPDGFQLSIRTPSPPPSALGKIILRGDPSSPKAMLQHSGNLNDIRKITGHIQTSLIIAIRVRCLEIVETLLKRGINAYAPAASDFGVTILQAAAMYSRLGIAKRLIDAGVNINAPGGFYGGRKALEAAAEHGRPNMAGFLLSLGIETTGKGQNHYLRAIGSAERESHHTVAKLLRAYCTWTEEDTSLIQDANLLQEHFKGEISESDTSTWYSQSEYDSKSEDRAITISLQEQVQTQESHVLIGHENELHSDNEYTFDPMNLDNSSWNDLLLPPIEPRDWIRNGVFDSEGIQIEELDTMVFD